MRPRPMPNHEPQQLGEFTVIEKIGQGAMGAVYKARQVSLGRLVALKVLPPHLAGDRDFLTRFKNEAMAAASLNHPNLVQVYAAGSDQGAHFFAMEYVDGESLGDRLDRKGRIEAREAIAIAYYVAEALGYAWKKAALIHRDIKPDNIFLSSEGTVKVGDLGLAKAVGVQDAGLTRTGTAMGTPYYISPEQAVGKKEVDFRSDIYSLGCTLYRALTGLPPYEGDSAMSVMLQHVNQPAPKIREAWPECPPPITELMDRMLSKRPEQRHESYEVLLTHLRKVMEQLDNPASVAANGLDAKANADMPGEGQRKTEQVDKPIPAGAERSEAPAARKDNVSGRTKSSIRMRMQALGCSLNLAVTFAVLLVSGLTVIGIALYLPSGLKGRIVAFVDPSIDPLGSGGKGRQTDWEIQQGMIPIPHPSSRGAETSIPTRPTATPAIARIPTQEESSQAFKIFLNAKDELVQRCVYRPSELAVVTGALAALQREVDPELARYFPKMDANSSRASDQYQHTLHTLASLPEMRKRTVKQLVELSLRAYCRTLDRYSDYDDDETYERVVALKKSDYVGVGVTIERTPDGFDCYPFPGGPADLVGCLSGDRLLAVDGWSVRDLSAVEVDAMFLGTEQSVVQISVRHRLDGKVENLKVERRKITSSFVSVEQRDSGLEVRLRGLTKEAVADLGDFLRTAKAGKPLTLDLRGCHGGEVEAAVAIAELFLPAGAMIGRLERPDGIDVFRSRNEHPFHAKPFVVLQDSGTASGAELLTVALATSPEVRAETRGERSFGKGVTVSKVQVEVAGIVRYADGRLYGPNREFWEGEGLSPTTEFR